MTHTNRGALSRRQVLFGIAGVAASAMLPACSPSSNESGAKATGTTTGTSAPSASGASMPPADEGTLQVWGAVPAESGPGAVVDAFLKKYPTYKVNYTRYVNDAPGNLKLDTALQGGLDIDVYFTYRSDYLALRTPLCADLTQYVKADPDLATFLDEGDTRVYRPDGKVLAIATNREPYFIAFNKNIGQTASVDLVDAWTVDEFVAASRKLAKAGTFGAYTIPDTARIALGPNYWYADDGLSNFADPHFLDWMTLGKQLVDDGTNYSWKKVVAQTQSSYQQSSFVKGEFAQWVMPPALLRYLHDPKNYPHTFTVAAQPLPTNDGTWNQGSYNNQIMMTPRSKRKDLAWLFMKFWLTEGGKYMLSGGKIPVIGNYTNDEILQGILGDDAEKYFDVDSFNRVLFAKDMKLSTDTTFPAYAEITLDVQKQRDSCWIGEKSPQAAIDTIRSQADAAIKKAKQ